jgi:nucleoside-diphosphate-sugar epimerase
MVLVIGATGTNGMELIKLLARQGIRVRALVRSPERARAISDLPAVELMVGDLKDLPRSRLLSFVDITPEAMKAALLNAGVPLWQADGLLEDYAHYRRDEASIIASGVKEATESSARSFAVFARDYAPQFC